MATRYVVAANAAGAKTLGERYWRCPECNGVFKFFHTTPEPPDRCILCDAWMSDEEPPESAFEPQAPLIRASNYARSVDMTYREMERQSSLRADEAADNLRDAYAREEQNDPYQGNKELLADLQKHQIAETHSTTKITDMADPMSLRQGDRAFKLPGVDAASHNLTMIKGQGPRFETFVGGSGMPNASEALSNVMGHSGWQNGTPASANPAHVSRAAAMIAAGNMGSFTNKR